LKIREEENPKALSWDNQCRGDSWTENLRSSCENVGAKRSDWNAHCMFMCEKAVLAAYS